MEMRGIVRLIACVAALLGAATGVRPALAQGNGAVLMGHALSERLFLAR